MSWVRRELWQQASGARERLTQPRRVAVIGGGIAGVAAATVLAERGASVSLVEREGELGGRAGAWQDALDDGESFEMERGFHAFFRQYYNLRALMRRVDPNLSHLIPLEDYPILGSAGLQETFVGLPKTPPFNVIALTKRTPHLRWRDLVKVNAREALSMLRYDGEQTYARYDNRSAREYLDSLRFPPRARAMLFNVFAHSFFNPEEDMSAAELLMMFHFYFMANPEGLVFDVLDQPFATGLWRPFARYLEGLGCELRLDCSATHIRRQQDGWHVATSRGEVVADELVLAVTVPALQEIIRRSPDVASHIAWNDSVASLALTNPFAVYRLWLDRPCRTDRPPFAGTTGVGLLDNISLYHLFEDESERWVERNGGAVIELHAYAIDHDYDEAAVRADLLAGLHSLYPETAAAKILFEKFFVRQDCPSFAPGSYASRPGVETPYDGLYLAGDFVKLPMPSALMERAATSGMLAANHILLRQGVEPEPLYTVPVRGLFAPRKLFRRAQ